MGGRLALALAVAGAVSIGLRFPFLSVPLTTDEGGYAYVAHWLGRGLALYSDLWFDRPQGIFLVYGVALRLFGKSTEAIRFGAALYNAGTVGLLYLLGARLYGRRAGLATAALFAVASASPVVEGFTANGELYMNLPVVASLVLAAGQRPFLAGVALALAAAIKPTALPTAAPALLVLLAWPHGVLRRPSRAASGPSPGARGLAPRPAARGGGQAPALRPRSGSREPARTDSTRPRAAGSNAGRHDQSPIANRGTRASGSSKILAAAPGALTTLAWLAFGAVAGFAPFLAHGVATDAPAYWYAVVGFRVHAHSALSVGEAVLRDLTQTAPSVLAALFPLWLLVALGVRAGGWRSRGGAAGLAYLGGSALGAAAGGYWYWHYYVGVLPAAALLGGAGLDRLLDRPATVGPTVLRAAVWACTAVAVAFNARLVGDTPEETSWNVYRRPAYLASAAIAAYLRAHTTEGDRIYAAFAQADLYHLSGRRSAGAHLYWTEINRVPGAFEAVLAALDDPARRPAYVIQIDRELEAPGRAAPFWERVARYYHPDAVIQGFTLYRAQERIRPRGSDPDR
jgi:hypothetical protein